MRVAPEEIRTVRRMLAKKDEAGHIPPGVIRRLVQDRAALERAAEKAMSELGVPGEGYPANVANAWRILSEARN